MYFVNIIILVITLSDGQHGNVTLGTESVNQTVVITKTEEQCFQKSARVLLWMKNHTKGLDKKDFYFKTEFDCHQMGQEV